LSPTPAIFASASATVTRTTNWSSEEERDVDVVVRRDAPVPHRTQQDAVEVRQPLPLPPSLQQLPPHPTTTTARNGPTTASRSRPQIPPNQLQTHTLLPCAQHPQRLARAQLQRQAQAARAQDVVEQAILEAERQREMFAKKQVPSAEELACKRTRSVGLLSQLTNPDPEIFQVNHPYRRGRKARWWWCHWDDCGWGCGCRSYCWCWCESGCGCGCEQGCED
jgi:hypothetical protein